MSRETDSSSSGPNGRGGAAYPSGTPPYGTPQVTESGADAGRSAAGAPPEERKTETTLTTRIRINIPGSRPIPPVVVRTPVTDTDVSAEGADSTGGAPRGGAEAPRAVSSPTGGPAVVEAPAGAAPAPAAAAAEEKTSDWFAPRKSGAPKGGPGVGPPTGRVCPAVRGPRVPPVRRDRRVRVARVPEAAAMVLPAVRVPAGAAAGTVQVRRAPLVVPGPAGRTRPVPAVRTVPGCPVPPVPDPWRQATAAALAPSTYPER